LSQGLKIAIIVFILTIVVVINNPKVHKEVSFNSSSNVALINNEGSVQDKEIKLSNKDSFKDTQTHQLSNIDRFKTSNTNINNIDNLNNKDNLSAQNKDMLDYESRLMAEYRRRNSLPEQKFTYKNELKIYNSNQPQIVLDPNYKTDNIEISEPFVEKEILAQNSDDTNYNKKHSQKKSNSKKYKKKNKYKKVKTKTPYEETIIWNKWKSDFHNKIHNDIAYMLPDDMPLGAFYKYSFVIDKYGNISNIDVKILFSGLAFDDSNREALKEGLQVFRKAIKNSKEHFEGFPEGSQRQSVKLELAVQMGFVNVYTNPGDFNDMEKVFGFR